MRTNEHNTNTCTANRLMMRILARMDLRLLGLLVAVTASATMVALSA